jgi:hypothetical protein
LFFLFSSPVLHAAIAANPFPYPETGQLRLDRNLIVISVLSGGREKGPSFSYSQPPLASLSIPPSKSMRPMERANWP